MTQNQIAYFNAQEQKRHDKAGEVELNRHNLIVEGLQSAANALQQEMNRETAAHYARSDANAAEANRINALHYQTSDLTQRMNAWENVRHDQATEALTHEMNVINARIAAETARHNLANEQLTTTLNTSTIAYNYAKAAETGANTAYLREQTKFEAEKAKSQKVTTQVDQKLVPLERGSSIAESWSRTAANVINAAANLGQMIMKGAAAGATF